MNMRLCCRNECTQGIGRSKGLPAFSLVEVIVVIAIIGVLLALLLPAVQSAREASRQTTCKNNLRQVGLGLRAYESANRKWPAGKKWSGSPNDPASFAVGWTSALLQHIEQDSLHNAINPKKPPTDAINLPATTQLIPIYLCPSTSQVEEHRTAAGNLINLGGIQGEGLGCIDYMGVSGPDKDTKHPETKELYGRQRGVLIGTKGLPLEDELVEPPAITSAKITDGLSHTLCVVECTGRGVSVDNGEIDALHGAWASGVNVSHLDKGVNTVQPPECWYKERMHADHPSGSHILMCDATVHFYTADVDKKIIRWMASRDGQEDVSVNAADAG
jgi:prepilin-type N-terminal cleavage/methylation domain-containing protein